MVLLLSAEFAQRAAGLQITAWLWWYLTIVLVLERSLTMPAGLGETSRPGKCGEGEAPEAGVKPSQASQAAQGSSSLNATFWPGLLRRSSSQGGWGRYTVERCMEVLPAPPQHIHVQKVIFCLIANSVRMLSVCAGIRHAFV